VKGALKMRAASLEHVKDAASLGVFIGGRVEEAGEDADWAVSKELYPGVTAYLFFSRADAEFPSRLRALYGGDKIRMVKGDELATLTVSLANQCLRYVRESSPDVKLPEVCYRV
jgi:hypothetical protein